MIYLNVILTILCILLLSVLVLVVFAFVKFGKLFTNSIKNRVESTLNQTTNSLISPDMITNIMKEMMANRTNK
jgi:uncharacterized membrane protein